MRVFVNHSWKLIVKSEIHCGLWPFQSPLKNNVIRAIFACVVITGAIPIAARMKNEWGVNYHIATENVGGFIILSGISLKVIMASVCNKKRQKIYEQVNHHSRTMTIEQEAFLLTKFSENGLKFCVKYMIVHCMVFAIFFTLPVAVMIFKYFTQSAEIIEKLFPCYVDYNIYYIDQDKYYVLVVLHIMILGFLGAGVNCAYDFGFIMNVRHVCALFEIVKTRIQEASGFLDEFEWDVMDFTTANNRAFELITKAIDLHNETLEYMTDSTQKFLNSRPG